MPCKHTCSAKIFRDPPPLRRRVTTKSLISLTILEDMTRTRIWPIRMCLVEGKSLMYVTVVKQSVRLIQRIGFYLQLFGGGGVGGGETGEKTRHRILAFLTQYRAAVFFSVIVFRRVFLLLLFLSYYVFPGAHNPERATSMRLCHGVFTRRTRLFLEWFWRNFEYVLNSKNQSANLQT